MMMGCEDLFRLLQALGDRLFVPHQVATEFWRNRASASHERLKMAGDTVERLEELGKNADKVLREWANRLAIADNVRETLLGALSGSFESVIGVVEPSEGALSETSHSETSKDPILLRLESILVDKVGPPFSEDDLRTNVKEGHRRVDAKIPPGFKDKDKKGDDVVGDFFVWIQTLREAARRKVDTLIFVTSDSSGDDWFRKEAGEVRGPRIELCVEAQHQAGARLLLLSTQSMVFHAQEALELHIEEETVSKIQRAEETSSTSADRPGWTKTTVDSLLSRLKVEAPVQYDAIVAAIESGGFVTRERVYELGGYDPDRTLRGFTRPARRIMQDLQDNALLSSDVQEPLQTVYDPEYSYVIASGFRVPDEFCHITSAAEPAAPDVILKQLRSAGPFGIGEQIAEQLREAGKFGIGEQIAEQLREAGTFGIGEQIAEQLREAGTFGIGEQVAEQIRELGISGPGDDPSRGVESEDPSPDQ